MGWPKIRNPFGGHNSIFNNPGQIWGGSNSIFRKPFGSGPGDPAAPPPPPDPAKATMFALNSQLKNELQMRRSNGLGAGLLSSLMGGMSGQTQSAGQLLLGS